MTEITWEGVCGERIGRAALEEDCAVVVVCSPARILMSVLFPAPFSPARAVDFAGHEGDCDLVEHRWPEKALRMFVIRKGAIRIQSSRDNLNPSELEFHPQRHRDTEDCAPKKEEKNGARSTKSSKTNFLSAGTLCLLRLCANHLHCARCSWGKQTILPYRSAGAEHVSPSYGSEDSGGFLVNLGRVLFHGPGPFSILR